MHLHAHKGSGNLCENHRSISLLSIAGMILARIILNRLNTHLDWDLLPKSQCGFRAGRGTVDTTFAARQLKLEIKRKMSRTKCPSVCHLHRSNKGVQYCVARVCELSWRSSVSPLLKFIAVVRQFHNGMNARV